MQSGMRFQWNELKDIPMRNINKNIFRNYDEENRNDPNYISYNM